MRTLDQLEYIFAFPGKKIFEVIFTTMLQFENCLERFQNKKKSTISFSKITMTPLAERDVRSVHVMIFSEKVRNQDVWTWMTKYCEVINAMEVMDIDGIRTGTRRFQVRLIRRDGVLQHIPSSIQLGTFKGSVFYPGQPKECRKCGSRDHLAAACTQDICRNCKATDHTSAQCSVPVKCNLCSSPNHRFKDCPHAYSNRVKLSTARMSVASSQEHMDEEPDCNQAPISNITPVLQPSSAAPQHSREESAIDQDEEAPDEKTVLDWGADPTEEGIGMSNNPSTPTEIPLTAQQADPLPNLELCTQTDMTPMVFQDAGKILDTIMADLPSPPGPGKPVLTEESDNLRLAEDQTSSPLLTITHSGPDSFATPTRKRQQESPSSGESSLLAPPVISVTDWPVSSPTSSPFLELNDVAAFSSATSIKNMTEEKVRVVKPKKKKLK